MRRATKAALLALYRYSGLLGAQEWLRQVCGRSAMGVLLFHRVRDDIPEDGLTVGCGRFRELCRLLAARFRVVPLGEVFRLARSGAALPRRTVAITFDDCYHDNLAAARVLAEHGLPATFFVPTAFVGTSHVFAWDRHLPPLLNLTWDDVRAMHRLGFEIGSHTVSHPDMGSISAEQAERELVESKAVLEERLGAAVRWFAYPFGGVKNFRGEWLPLLRRAGYEGCVSGFGGLVRRGDRHEVLPRVPVPSFPTNLGLEVRLTGCLDWYYDLKRRLGLSEVRRPCLEFADGPALPPAEEARRLPLGAPR